MKKLMGWKELPEGDALAAGTSKEFETGDWRSIKRIFIPEKCINCLQCWMYCPDSAIIVKEGKFVEFDYKYCKGCGICEKICPTKPKSIKMEAESK